MTQPSSTLNRRYVSRPTNLAIEEAARSSVRRQPVEEPSTPSRLVNLRVHDADLKRLIPSHANPTESAPVPPSASSPFLLEADNAAPAQTSSLPNATPDLKDLALDIAADYTTASMGATLSNLPAEIESTSSNKLAAAIKEQHATESVDEIARAAAESIAAIRAASDPTDIADQITALEKFATQIKTDSSLPEIAELGETIEKFIKIASKSTGVQEELNKKKLLSAKSNHAVSHVTKASPKTLNSSANVASTPKPSKIVLGHSAKISRSTATPVQSSKSSKPSSRLKSASLKPFRAMRRPTQPKAQPTLQPDEDSALQQALSSVTEMDEEERPARHLRRHVHRRGSIKRFALALGCAAACVAAIIYFVGANMPDLSVRVAAMQTGVDASYPSYIPHGFSLDEINSENGKITLKFSNTENKSFTLIEEKSSWDSTALLRNYVEPTWQNNYTTTHEQGITIYLYGTSAAWVNGGVLYKIECSGNSLTKKQLRNIVTSIQ